MVEIKNLCTSYGKNKILDGISFKAEPYTITALIGKNATGKSTLLSCITGEKKYTGEILINSKSLSLLSARDRAKLVALMPQTLPSVDISGEHLIKLGRTPHLDLGRHFTKEDFYMCEKAAKLTGCETLIKKRVSEMSGGEKQKIYLAMMFAQNTPFIALDEPASYMDTEHEKELYTLIHEAVKVHKKTALIVMHDLTRAVEISDNIALLDGGKIVFFGSSRKAKESGIIEKHFSVEAYDCGKIRIYR